MALKAIKIGEENYKKLVKLSAELQSKSGEMVSIDKAITSLLLQNEKNNKPSRNPETINQNNQDHHRHYVG